MRFTIPGSGRGPAFFVVQAALAGMFLALALAVPAKAQEWRRFDGAQGFSVMYPANWYRRPQYRSADGIALLDSQDGGAEGVLIKRGHAHIEIREEQIPSGTTLSQMIDRNLRDSKGVVERRKIPVPSGPQNCTALTKVVSKYEVVPAQDIPMHIPLGISTSFFCEAPGRAIVLTLLNWKDDRRQPLYQSVALRMAQSIRLIH